jgi:hypothetical protein
MRAISTRKSQTCEESGIWIQAVERDLFLYTVFKNLKLSSRILTIFEDE